MTLFFAAIAADNGGDAVDGDDDAGGRDADGIDDNGGDYGGSVSDRFSYDVGGANRGRDDSKCLWSRHFASPIILITSH